MVHTLSFTKCARVVDPVQSVVGDQNAVVEMKSDITMGPKDGLHIKFQPVL